MNKNPLLNKSKLPFEAPAFDKISNADFLPAFKAAIKEAKAEIDKIASSTSKATFENTIEAIEYSGLQLDELSLMFFNLLEAVNDEQKQEAANKLSPLLTEYSLYLSLSKPLFSRVKEIYDNKDNLDLSVEQQRLLEKTYKSMLKNGANLPEDKKESFSKCMEELSLLELKFGNNLLAATNDFLLHIDNKEELAGLPEFVVEMAADKARQQGVAGWIFSLHRPSYEAFMKYSSIRSLREKLYKAFSSRALGGDFDNTTIIKQILERRKEIATLLDYESYADLALENRMAKTVATVDAFLNELIEYTLPAAKKEISELYSFAREQGFQDEQLMPWDFKYYSEKYYQQKYSVNEELLKPYYKLENCIDAVFSLASSLYGLTFIERKDLPVYHPDVQVYQVLDENKEHLSLLYTDFFNRDNKSQGAWMTEFKAQYFTRKASCRAAEALSTNEDSRPIISIVMNFAKSSSETGGQKPNFIKHEELVTFLHEFGHALHGMLSKCKYSSLSGTNVARDFVELPSQIMENWAYEKEFLQTFAYHYITGEILPEEYIDKIANSKNFFSATYQLRQLNFAILDMAWHKLDSHLDSVEDIPAFERSILGKYSVLPSVDSCAISTSFSHIFAGGYSAGYYSYKWAEMLQADAFSLFKEKGIFNKELSSKFRKAILEKGSSEDEERMYHNFRGTKPDVKSLLDSLGIIY